MNRAIKNRPERGNRGNLWIRRMGQCCSDGRKRILRRPRRGKSFPAGVIPLRKLSRTPSFRRRGRGERQRRAAHYYAASGDERFRPLLFAAAERFMRLDKTALRMQTHAALTAGRALLVLYAATKEKRLLEGAKRLFSLYREKGMTLTYENFNWFGREDTWTEPSRWSIR